MAAVVDFVSALVPNLGVMAQVGLASIVAGK